MALKKKLSLNQGWANFLIRGPQWVLTFDKGAGPGADGWSALVTPPHWRKNTHLGIWRKRALISNENEEKNYNKISHFGMSLKTLTIKNKTLTRCIHLIFSSSAGRIKAFNGPHVAPGP